MGWPWSRRNGGPRHRAEPVQYWPPRGVAYCEIDGGLDPELSDCWDDVSDKDVKDAFDLIRKLRGLSPEAAIALLAADMAARSVGDDETHLTPDGTYVTKKAGRVAVESLVDRRPTGRQES